MKETTQNFQELFDTLSDGKSQDCGNVKRLVWGGGGGRPNKFFMFFLNQIK